MVSVGDEWRSAAFEVLAQLCLAFRVSGLALGDVELEFGSQEGWGVFSDGRLS